MSPLFWASLGAGLAVCAGIMILWLLNRSEP